MAALRRDSPVSTPGGGGLDSNSLNTSPSNSHRHGHNYSKSHTGLNAFASSPTSSHQPMDRSSSSGAVSLSPSPGATSNGNTNTNTNSNHVGLSPNLGSSSNSTNNARFRSSVDAARSLYANSAGAGGFGSGGSLQPGSAAGSANYGAAGAQKGSKRPSSELLAGNAGFGGTALSAENDAIDKWFEDLHHYEATLEEMAAASLDQSFKEELGAIEQWFRVLSEAERTAALYSLLQSSSQVQIRFFITVLQQMARSDPMNALLSPANPQQASMEAQMEARLANLGLKSPASPAVRQFARQSLGAMPPSDPSAFLSPNSAMLHHSASPRLGATEDLPSSSSSTDPANLLAQQRAKLNANAANRISAPGSLLSTYDSTAPLRSPLWSQANSDQVAERPLSLGGQSATTRSPSPDSRLGRSRPSSMISDHGGNTSTNAAAATATNETNKPNTLGPNSSSSLLADAQLSPLLSNPNWASMMATPLMSTFGAQLTGNADSTFQNSQSNSSASKDWATQTQQTLSQIVLDDAKKFRRNARGSDVGLDQNNSSSGVQGILSGMYGDTNRRTSSGSTSNQQTGQTNANQAAAVAAQQNWRNINGLLGQQQNNNQYSGSSSSSSPNLSGLGSPDLSNSIASLQAAMTGMNANSPQLAMANLLAAQQQLQQQMQLQQNLNLMNMGMSPMGMMNLPNALQNQQMLSPVLGGMGMGMFNAPLTGNSQRSDRRSPRPSDRGLPSASLHSSQSKQPIPQVAGSGSNPDEPIDLTLLSDVPAWLRSLRLHKYTPNFETSTWKEMVLMDDSALEAKGVAALGARRKLLKVFENVRNSQNIPHPPGARPTSSDGPGDTSTASNE